MHNSQARLHSGGRWMGVRRERCHAVNIYFGKCTNSILSLSGNKTGQEGTKNVPPNVIKHKHSPVTFDRFSFARMFNNKRENFNSNTQTIIATAVNFEKDSSTIKEQMTFFFPENPAGPWLQIKRDYWRISNHSLAQQGSWDKQFQRVSALWKLFTQIPLLLCTKGLCIVAARQQPI